MPDAALDWLDAAAVRRWSRIAIERLTAHRSEIDALNVFPVADGDTGGNLLQTLRAADDELTRTTGDGDGAGAALTAMANGAAWGAIGNSGFIASQVLRGLADTANDPARDAEHCDAATLAAGLVAGAVLAREAVVAPVEGTVLTVARAAGEAAQDVADKDLAAVAAAALAAAETALQATPDQLAALAAHGVVDAGGRGYVVLLDALCRVVTGTGADLAPVATPDVDVSAPLTYRFEVQYRITAASAAIDGLRDRLAQLGDSVAVVALEPGRDDAASHVTSHWKVHVHVDDVGAAIEAGVAAGRPHDIAVVGLAEGHGSCDAPTGTAVVAVAPGVGLAHLFAAEGVVAVDGTGGDPPSTAEVLAAIREAGRREVVLLPNASVVTGVAEAAAVDARRDGLRVAVVPTRSPVQGMAAIAVHDAARPFDDDVVAMAEAAAATRFAELSVATGPALTAVGRCEAGDVLGMIDGEVVEVGRGMLAVAFGLVDRLLGVGAELMTVVVGEDAPRRAGELVEAHIRGRAPLTDVTVFEGGQSDHPLIIGAE